jgi:hypothetical protein
MTDAWEAVLRLGSNTPDALLEPERSDIAADTEAFRAGTGGARSP